MIHYSSFLRSLVLAMVLSSSLLPAQAALFGRNKLQTRQFVWQVYETDHFEIHYYPEIKKLAQEVCVYAEQAYQLNTKLIRFKPQQKIPLFLYRNKIDFQQTNILPHVIGTGTGGFTEAFKNRIALPAPASPQALREVVIHETMHALQFSILYGEGIRSFRVYKGYLIPLWLIEGMAEYASGRWDARDNMILRDAVIHDRLWPLDLLDGFNHVDDVYLAYKQAQMVMIYISETFGEDKIGLIFNKFKYQLSITQILRETLGMGLKAFNHQFMLWIKQRYWLETENKLPLAYYGPLVDPLPKGRLVATSGAAWSPDGQYLAFISNKDQTMRIYLKPRGKNRQAYPITGHHYEQVANQGRPISWSPDSRFIAFVAQQAGKQQLMIVNSRSRHVKCYDLPLDGLSSPTWSPQGDQIALAGTKNGVTDIYIWHQATNSLTPLSNDRWLDETPCWSDQGNQLIYSSQRHNHWQLIKRSLAHPEKEQHLLPAEANHIQPALSPDERDLYFISDQNGTNNLYRYDQASRTTVQLTDALTGVFQPTVHPNMSSLCLTGYENGQWGIRLMNPPTENNERLGQKLNAKIDTDTLPTAPAAAIATSTAQASLTASTANASFAVSDPMIKDHYPYRFRFSPDLLFLLAGYDSSQGVVGGGYMTASDYLGDHQISLTSDFVPGYQARTILSYLNSTYPVDIAVAARYSRNYYRIIDLETETKLDEFNDQEIGGGIQLSKPISIFDRVELEYAMQFVQRERDEQVDQKRLSTIRLSLIHDQTKWLDFAPSNGWRYHLSVTLADKILGGEEQYQLAQLDSQVYQTLDFINPYMVLSTRLFGAVSSGPEHPVYLYGGIGILPNSVTIRGFKLGELLGSQLATLNLECRFPLARNMHYSLWPLDFLMMKHLQMVLFNDTGIVTHDIFKLAHHDIKNAIGMGLRLQTFMLGKELLTIRFDVATRTDSVRETIYSWGIGQSF